jgi:hypothetical protein
MGDGIDRPTEEGGRCEAFGKKCALSFPLG